MAVRKVAISLDPRLAERVQASARERGVSVSSWLADAAAKELQHQQLGEYLKQYEAEFGPITDHELAEVEADWPGGHTVV